MLKLNNAGKDRIVNDENNYCKEININENFTLFSLILFMKIKIIQQIFMLKSNYLSNLNEKQQEAVESLDGPLLIVAGAGSGKTKVLTSRIAHIISHKAFSNQILAVTFTNKAAKEMQIRVSKLLRKEATGLPWLGTFHSISSKILRKHAEAVGLNQILQL